MTDRQPPAGAVRSAFIKDIESIERIWWWMIEEHIARDPEYWRLKPHDWVREKYKDWIKSLMLQGGLDSARQHCLLVAEREAEVIGFVHGYVHERDPIFRDRLVGHIDDVAVHPDHRGQGVGRALLDGIEAELIKNGATILNLMVDVANPGAERLYRAIGYRARERMMIKPVK